MYVVKTVIKNHTTYTWYNVKLFHPQFMITGMRFWLLGMIDLQLHVCANSWIHLGCCSVLKLVFPKSIMMRVDQPRGFLPFISPRLVCRNDEYIVHYTAGI